MNLVIALCYSFSHPLVRNIRPEEGRAAQSLARGVVGHGQEQVVSLICVHALDQGEVRVAHRAARAAKHWRACAEMVVTSPVVPFAVGMLLLPVGSRNAKRGERHQWIGGARPP